jgi:hypothetical protein
MQNSTGIEDRKHFGGAEYVKRPDRGHGDNDHLMCDSCP